MGRYIGPVCRLCRREGVKLFLKGARCNSSKCAIEKSRGIPGMHKLRRGKPSEYALRLREKQKVKRTYGIFERQFRNYYEEATRRPGNSGDALLALIERRLDNVVARLGFAQSRAQARQMIRHGHFTVNGRKLDIPSYLVKPGDTIKIKDREASRKLAAEVVLSEAGPSVPSWLDRISTEPPEGRVSRLPGSEDLSREFNTQLIIELLSR